MMSRWMWAAGLTAMTWSASAAGPPNLVRAVKVQPDAAPDCSSLSAIVESVTRGCETNDQKAIAIYNFMRLTHYHRAYPREGEPGGLSVLKEIHCYGWSLCGGLHAQQSALWRELGWDWRFVGWPGHTTVEAFYDGRWHYLDVFLKFYAWMPDPADPSRRTIAGQDDLAADPDRLMRAAFVRDEARQVTYAKGDRFEVIDGRANWRAPAFLVCGDSLESIVEGVRRRETVGPSPGWGGIRHETGDYSADVDLGPGFALTNTWDPIEGAWHWAGSEVAPCHTCGDKGFRNSPEKGPIAEPYLEPDRRCESYANGRIDFRPDLSSARCLDSFAVVENVRVGDGGLEAADANRPGRLVVRLASPYVLTAAGGSAEGVDDFEVSTDAGRTWRVADLADFGSQVAGRTEALARLTFRGRLSSLRLAATVQNNPFALPYLSPGRNTVTVSVADPSALGGNELVVTYAYRPGFRDRSYERLHAEGKQIARAHGATWEETPTVVRRAFRAADLPATFEIDVPTPEGRHPVYPRMLFVSREVVTPGGEPLPLPEGARPPRREAGDELKALPSPFLVGTRPPARR